MTRRTGRRIGFGLAVLSIVLGSAAVVEAAPSTNTNKNALTVTLDCGDRTIVGMTILQNAAVALQVVDGDGTVAQMVELWSYSDAARTQDETLWFTTPGFGHNGADSLTCTWTNALYPDLYWRGEVVLHPGH